MSTSSLSVFQHKLETHLCQQFCPDIIM